MTTTDMPPSELPKNHDEGGFLRAVAEAVLRWIRETDDGVIGAGRHERPGALNLRVPKLRQGSYV